MGQTGQTTPTQNQSQTSATSGETTIQGCLRESNGSFTLISASGQTYQLTGNTDSLSPQVGHEVQLTGNISNASASTETNPGETGTTQAMFNVSSVKQVSDTCTSGGGAGTAASGAMTGTATQESQAASQSDPATDPNTNVNPAYPGSQSGQSAVGTNPAAESSAASGAYPSTGEPVTAPMTAQTTPSGQSAETNPSGTMTEPNPSGQTATGQETQPSGQQTNPSSATSQTRTETGQQSNAAEQGKKLPQTASPLPLLALLGVGSLGTGLLARRKK